MSIHQEIEEKIQSLPEGDIFFPAEFRMLGNDDAIKMALSRLVKVGAAERRGGKKQAKRVDKPCSCL